MEDETGDDAAQLASLPPSRDENPWVVERTPTRLDAERAHRPLDPGLILSFQHAIRNEMARDTTYFDTAAEALVRSCCATMDVHYPATTLAENAPDAVPDVVLGQLLETFRLRVRPYMPFLSNYPVEHLQPMDLHGYLAYAMAIMGSLVAQQHPDATITSLWLRANALITAGLELDNREARRPQLITAWALLATYGALCADEASWRQTNVCHGYVVTAARRLHRSPIMNTRWNALQALLLADVLRSVHYAHPLTLSAIDCLAGPSNLSSQAIEIYRTIMQGHPAVGVSETGGDDALMVLVALLADIHTFAHVIHPLGTASQPDLNKSSSFQSPFVPLSATNETRRAQRKLSKALDLWARAYLEASSQDLLVLYYFCQMHLTLPTLQALPVLAGYPPRLACDGPATYEQQTAADFDLRGTAGPEAQNFAWQIVEHVDTRADRLPAPWAPIAVFYAGLVVWRCCGLKLDSSTSHGTKKVLLLFVAELRRMPWPCCPTMAQSLEALIH